MLNYLLSAEAGWKNVSNLLRWRLGDKYRLEALFVNGELVDFTVEGEKEDQSQQIKYDGNAYFDEQIEFIMQGVCTNKPAYLIVEDMLVSFYHSLVDDFDRKVHHLVFDTTPRHRAFLVSVLNSDEETILVTSNQMLFNLVP